MNARLVLRFTQPSGMTRWVAVGRDCGVMQTEDHVCHLLNRTLFRELVEMLGIKSRIIKYDPLMAKYL